ncbi:MAG: hypothetical protein KIS78_04240 [Labilithrix sp.]|nr:hypothetical protein [Labilithrix sp.]
MGSMTRGQVAVALAAERGGVLGALEEQAFDGHVRGAACAGLSPCLGA